MDYLKAYQVLVDAAVVAEGSNAKTWEAFQALGMDLDSIIELADKRIRSGSIALSVNTNAKLFDITSSTLKYKIQGTYATFSTATGVSVASTTGTKFVKDAIVIDKTSGLAEVVSGESVGSTVSQALAPLPTIAEDKLLIGWLELPKSFTPGATNVTAAMLKVYTQEPLFQII